ncbi:energy transducer TonB [Marinicella gelatinilytica]|uniref:energy transducer TonB n=1 Tax=Marinicella gelatinilytica TaxID=2996017 RepID=UPI002260B249|nr:energy transducer TonB [Marinicella gelatinilytica]MCX7544094.1 energy transducer TonB [Marinicella gelatinilytica]
MSLPRFLAVAFVAAFITVVLYLLMHLMISQSSNVNTDSDNITIDFTKVKVPDDVQQRKRVVPKKPPPPKEPPPPPKMNVQQNQQVVNNMPTLNVPNLDLGVGGDGPFLGAVGQVNMSEEGGVIPIVRIAPQYPRKALMAKIEGWVKVKFTISPSGTVTNPEVVDAKPRRIFDREAIRAILKFKFKPKIVNGQGVEQVATQVIEFELPKE